MLGRLPAVGHRGTLLACPQRLAGRKGIFRTPRGRIVRADHVDSIHQRGILPHPVRNRPGANLVRRHDLRCKPRAAERRRQHLDILRIIRSFVPDPRVVDLQAVDGIGTPDEFGHEIRILLRIETPAADPARSTPLQHVECDRRIAALRLTHQPPFVTPREVGPLGPGPVVGRLRAAGRIDIAADLHLQVVERRPVAGFKQVVEDLRTVRLRIVGQKARRGPGTQGADPLVGPAGIVAVHQQQKPRSHIARSGRQSRHRQPRPAQNPENRKNPIPDPGNRMSKHYPNHVCGFIRVRNVPSAGYRPKPHPHGS